MSGNLVKMEVQVSLLNGTSPKIIKSIPIDEALERIRNGQSKKLVEEIRSKPDKKERDEVKKQLPAIVFQGVFSYRDKKHLVKHSQLAILDSDHVMDPSFFRDYIFNNYDFVLASWISPSGDGVKFLCKIPEISTDDEYKQYYQRLLQVFDDASTDPSNSDISRICFESYDPGIRIREWDKTTVFIEKIEPQSVPSVKSNSQTTNINPLDIATKMIQNAVDGQKHYVLLKAAKLLGGYVGGNLIQETEAAALLESEIQKKNIGNFDLARRTIKSGIEFGKLNPIFLPEQIYNEEIKEASDTFWYTNKKGFVVFESVKMMSFLVSKGIFRYYTSITDYSFIKIEVNLVEQIDIPFIKRLLSSHIVSVSDDKVTIAFQYVVNQIAGPANLQLLESKEVPIFRGEKHKAYIFYKDFIYTVTGDSIIRLDYADFNHLIWKSTIINRNAPIDRSGIGEFEIFLDNVFKDEASRRLIRQSLGYMLHNFKDKAFMPALILNDNNEDDNSQGGTGKGIITQGLNKFLNTLKEDGKRFDPLRVFSYQNLNLDTQLFVIDDAKKHFNIEDLFSFISEGVYIEKKGKQPHKIEFEDMPKILVTTNYAVKGSGESHKRRRLDLVLDNHYSSKHTPKDEFEHLLFDDWDKEQWDLFDIFMLRCISTYLEEGIKPIEHVNLLLKQFRLETHQDFEDFAERLSVNTEHDKTDLLIQWRKESGIENFSKKVLSSWLNKFAKIKGYDLKSDRKADRYVLSTQDF
jgi:hypothetical protein